MHVYIVFTHPRQDTFTHAVLDAFTRGLGDAGHTYTVNDLYATGFKAELDAEQYAREVAQDPALPLPHPVQDEHKKIKEADALAFIYPLWWGDVPALLKGWFDRVWSYGFAYVYKDGKFTPQLDDVAKALAICGAGDAVEFLEAHGIVTAMRRIMLDNRLLAAGIKDSDLVILGGMEHPDSPRDAHLARAYQLGRDF